MPVKIITNPGLRIVGIDDSLENLKTQVINNLKFGLIPDTYSIPSHSGANWYVAVEFYELDESKRKVPRTAYSMESSYAYRVIGVMRYLLNNLEDGYYIDDEVDEKHYSKFSTYIDYSLYYFSHEDEPIEYVVDDDGNYLYHIIRMYNEHDFNQYYLSYTLGFGDTPVIPFETSNLTERIAYNDLSFLNVFSILFFKYGDTSSVLESQTITLKLKDVSVIYVLEHKNDDDAYMLLSRESTNKILYGSTSSSGTARLLIYSSTENGLVTHSIIPDGIQSRSTLVPADDNIITGITTHTPTIHDNYNCEIAVTTNKPNTYTGERSVSVKVDGRTVKQIWKELIEIEQMIWYGDDMLTVGGNYIWCDLTSYTGTITEYVIIYYDLHPFVSSSAVFNESGWYTLDNAKYKSLKYLNSTSKKVTNMINDNTYYLLKKKIGESKYEVVSPTAKLVYSNTQEIFKVGEAKHYNNFTGAVTSEIRFDNGGQISVALSKTSDASSLWFPMGIGNVDGMPWSTTINNLPYEYKYGVFMFDISRVNIPGKNLGYNVNTTGGLSNGTTFKREGFDYIVYEITGDNGRIEVNFYTI